MLKRLQYKNLILKEFYYAGSLSCAELSARIGKSIPLTMQILDDLIKEDLIDEEGLAPSNGGRPPSMYSVKAAAMYFVAVAMDQLVTRVAIFDFANKAVMPATQFNLELANNPTALFQLKEVIDSAIKKSKIAKKKIIGVGIGMPGFIDAKKGMNYSFLFSENDTITGYLSKELGVQIYIDNDSSLIALAEHRFGAAIGIKNAMVINLGWGIGLGLILNDQLYRGENGFAGEFSHIPMYDNDTLCSCGKRGCLETETSLRVIIEKAERGLKQKANNSSLHKNFRTGLIEKDWAAVVKAALSGDRFIIKLLTAAGYDIGRGVSILIHLFNPGTVVLSGRGAQVGRVWQAPILQAINEHCIPRLATNTMIKISNLGYNAELIGAAALVMENLVRLRPKQVLKPELI